MLSIEDRLGLQDLIANYSWALDTGDADGLVACFTEDAVMSEEVFEDPDVWEGHAGIRGLMNHYANAPGFPGRQHHVTQTQYRPQPDGSVKMRSFAFVTECEGEPPYVLRFTGWYDDHPVRGPRRQWRFSVAPCACGTARCSKISRARQWVSPQAPELLNISGGPPAHPFSPRLQPGIRPAGFFQFRATVPRAINQ